LVAASAVATEDATIVINNAGASAGHSLLALPLDEVRAAYETNVFGPIAVAQAFAPVLAKNGGGALVGIHSALSWLARPGVCPSTKAALWSVTNTLRLELAAQGTQVLGAHMAYVDTPMTARLDVPKSDPRDIVAAIYDGLEAGAHEVVADGTSRWIKQQLSLPLTSLYPELAER
jgi:NAD(P)-dependent dehydrogenase (short-subunit alcohol dehydrogenase family)